jgi:hypothetical protein
MNKLAPFVLALAPLLLATGAQAQNACVYTQAPQSLPIGTQASEAEMKAAHAIVKEYLKSVQEVYLPCLDKETQTAVAALDPKATDFEVKKNTIVEIQKKRYNATVMELKDVEARWNAEIRAFKEKTAK